MPPKPPITWAELVRLPANSQTSDFPTLSGGPQPASNAGQSNWNSNILRQQPAQQQQQPQPIQQRAPQQAQAPQPPQQQSHQQQQQQQQQQRVPSATLSQQSVDQQEDQRVQQASSEQSNGGGDEFPPLGVRTNGEAFEQNNGLGGVTLRSPDDSQTQGNGQQTQLPFRETSNTSTQAQQAPIGHPLTQTTSQQQQPQSILAAPVQPAAPSGGVKRYADMSEQEQWGLEALSAAYEARKNLESGQPVDETLPPIMRSAIFFGQDLSALGMDLDSLDPIYPTFTPFPAANSTGSTFDFHDRHTIPDFQLPGAYTVNNVPPLAGRVAALSDGNAFPISCR
jgi:CCR4-NOT transcription complex subunit 2